MKKIASIFILLLSMVSCSNDNADSRSDSNYYGKWKLTKSSGSFVEAIYIIGQPQYQEYYDFKKDNTFVKTRTKDGLTTTASGTFSITRIQNRKHFQLTYTNESDLIETCTGNLNEELFINEAGEMISTWQNCDGPTLIYEKTK